MQKRKISFLQDALDDLEGLIEYISNDSILSAEKIYKKVREKSDALSLFPFRGMPVPDEKLKAAGWRMLFILPLVLFYRVFDEEVMIFRIFHSSSDYPRLFNMLEEKSGGQI